MWMLSASSACRWVRRVSDAIMASIPGDEAFDAGFDWRTRREIDGAGEIVDVGEGGGHIAWLHGQVGLDRALAGGGLDHFDQAVQLHRRIVADIVDAIGRAGGGRIRRLAAPAGIR